MTTKETCEQCNRPARYELFTTMPNGTEVRQTQCKVHYDCEEREVAGHFFVARVVDLKAAA